MTEGDQILLKEHLKGLKLFTMQKSLPEMLRQSKAASSSYEEFLLTLCERELQRRHSNRLVKRIKDAKFPLMKTLEETDIEKWKSFDGTKIREYASGEYIKKKENPLLIDGMGPVRPMPRSALELRHVDGDIVPCLSPPRVW